MSGGGGGEGEGVEGRRYFNCWYLNGNCGNVIFRFHKFTLTSWIHY